MLTIAVMLGACGACGACGDDGNHADAHNNGDGMCGADDFYTGEMVDWDSTDNVFCGVFNAGLTVHGDAARVDHTNPNGRFQLCLAPAPTTQIDITPPTQASQCAPAHGLYQIPGVAIASSAVINSGKLHSYRMIGASEVGTQFPTYDGGLALLFVHVEGTPHAVTATGTHDPPIAWNGTAWAAGDTGIDVVFPNISGTSTMVGVSGGSAIGTGMVPLTAGQFTYVTIVGN